ncbi:hypothetical protein LIER_05291 [Lithospermum erythrorhizon]|uniref:Mitochondrial protein n=1 Tax=Lithospermum erythrorhizon TaxID=34254 RepID=A0AAV3P1L3_LITER
MSNGIFISQSKSATNMLKRFVMENVKEKRTPDTTYMKVGRDEKGEGIDVKLYQGMLGRLLYLIASRPDISHVVGVCARFQANPKESHLGHVKRILKYVKGTLNLGLLNTFDTTASLVGYCDADWACDNDDRKSTELVEDKIVTLEDVSIDKQLADIFTKSLTGQQFESLRSTLRLCTLT